MVCIPGDFAAFIRTGFVLLHLNVFIGFRHAVDRRLKFDSRGLRGGGAGAGHDIIGLVSIIDRDKFTM